MDTGLGLTKKSKRKGASRLLSPMEEAEVSTNGPGRLSQMVQDRGMDAPFIDDEDEKKKKGRKSRGDM